MPFCLKSTTDDSTIFGLTLDQFKALMALYGKEFMDKLNSSEYGGVRGVLEKLVVAENQGLSVADPHDLRNRKRIFGKNEYSQPSASFFRSPLDWISDRRFRRAQTEIKERSRVTVICDNKTCKIHSDELVVGDICVLKSGMELPADGLLIQGTNLEVDELYLTGEADLARKNDTEDARLLCSAQVKDGEGLMVVVAVGMNSQAGIILQLINAKKN